MKYVNGPPSYPLLGTHLDFCISVTPQFVVRYVEETAFYERIIIELPVQQKHKWVEVTATIIGLTQSSRHWPVRMNYSNTLEFFSSSQLAVMERLNPAVSFQLYDAPAKAPSSFYAEAAKLERKLWRENAKMRTAAQVEG